MKYWFKRFSASLLLYYSPYIVSFMVILRSRPFLKLPYDMWDHLMLIRGWYQDGEPILTRPGVTSHEVLWHRIWAAIFKFLQVSDVFSWAKIIHCTQFAWTMACIVYFTDVCLKYGVGKIHPSKRRLLALLGAWCFILGAGTFSVQYQLSWILWYSVNYQGFTLPAYFLASGLLIDLFLANESPLARFQMIFLALLFIAMIAIHPLEASYFLIFLAVFVLFFSREILGKLKRSPAVALVVLGPFFLTPILLYVLPIIGIPLPRPSGLGGFLDLKATWSNILSVGQHLQVNGLHRGLSTFNELAILGCALCGILAVLQTSLLKMRRESPNLQVRVLLFLLAIAVGFALIPRLTLTSGVLALLTVDSQVWRFAFASPWFVGFALWASFAIGKSSGAKGFIFAIIPVIIVSFYSRFITSGPFNTTAASVVRSLELIDRHNVDIQFNRAALKRLDETILSSPPAPNPLKNIFLIRSDLQSYVRAATGAYVLGYRLGPVSILEYDRLPDKSRYQLVIIDPPDDLPVDQEMAKSFWSMRL